MPPAIRIVAMEVMELAMEPSIVSQERTPRTLDPSENTSLMHMLSEAMEVQLMSMVPLVEQSKHLINRLETKDMSRAMVRLVGMVP